MMKSFFKKLAFVMALAMVVSMAAPAATTASAASDLKIAYQNGGGYGITELNIAEVGATEDLKFLGAPNWKEAGVKWTSNNEAVATVDQNGLVTAVAAGTAEVACQVGTDVAVVKVNVVDVATYTATMGTADDRNITAKTIEEGDTFDFAFYGIKDYDVKRYFCTWASDDTSVATVDQKGLVTAVKAGTAKITLIVFNKVTGQVHNVDACTVTVPSVEPTVAPVVTALEATQTTENDMYITFTGVDVTKLTKADIEIYEYYTTENGADFEYIWQIKSVKADADKNILYVEGYVESEFVDGATYAVRLVEKDGDNTKAVLEDSFVASVGLVDKLVAGYESYKNNQYYWTFQNKAYTNAGSGEDIDTHVWYTLYDKNGIDVTGHYKKLNGWGDLVTLELVSEDVDSYMEINEDANTIRFFDIPENPYVKFNVVYEDYDNDVVKNCELGMTVEDAPAYKVTSIDDWGITLTDGDHSWMKLFNKDVALFDDYDQAGEIQLNNHEIVLKFTDNYGNKWITNSNLAGDHKPYVDIQNSKKFTDEDFEIRFESRNPQVLVIGGEEDGNATNSSVITTKKVGRANVNVSLYNTYEDKLISRMDVLSISVKAERYIATVNAENVTLTTDAIKYEPEDVAGDNTYETDFTTGNLVVSVKDQYGETWGKYNTTRRTMTSVVAEVTNMALADAYASMNVSFNSSADAYKKSLDGKLLSDATGTADKNESSIAYKVTVTDTLKDKEKTDTFRVALKYPKLDGSKIDLASKLIVTGKDSKLTKLSTGITVIERSTNGLDVNYADDIVLITDEDVYEDLFVTKTATTSALRFLLVLDPKGEVVPESTVYDDTYDKAIAATIGIREKKSSDSSGNYVFQFADTKAGNGYTEFARTGSYTVKFIEVTGMNADDTIKTYKTTTDKFTVSDDLVKVQLKNQEAIFIEEIAEFNDKNDTGVAEIDGIEDVVRYALSFKYDWGGDITIKNGWGWNQVAAVAGVRYRENQKAKSVVIQDVYLKVYIDVNGDWNYSGWKEWNTSVDDSTPAAEGLNGIYYFVKVDVDKTVSLEDIDMATGTSIKYNQTPYDYPVAPNFGN